MEMNGRHNRSGLLAVKCGINFPWIEYQGLINQDFIKNYTNDYDYPTDIGLMKFGTSFISLILLQKGM